MKMARRERIKTREKVEQKWPKAEEDAAAAAEEVAVEEEEEASIEVALTAEEVAALRRVGVSEFEEGWKSMILLGFV